MCKPKFSVHLLLMNTCSFFEVEASSVPFLKPRTTHAARAGGTGSQAVSRRHLVVARAWRSLEAQDSSPGCQQGPLLHPSGVCPVFNLKTVLISHPDFFLHHYNWLVCTPSWGFVVLRN